MRSWLWMTVRFCLSAWVGAAALFVVTGVREVTSPQFDSIVRNQLAALRFPAYYAFGFALVPAALLTALTLSIRGTGRGRARWIAGLCALALLVMLFDWFRIYLPLEAMMRIPEGSKPAEFRTYHEWSKYLNFLSVGLCFVAALLSCLEHSSAGSVEPAR